MINWSGGKDCTLALHHILNSNEYEVVTMLTTLSQEHNRISMHGVRRELLDAQVASIGIHHETISLPTTTDMTTYDLLMRQLLDQQKSRGVTHSIFGDIFLEDLKAYRDSKLSQVGMKGVYPLWKRKSSELLTEFISLGYKAVITCANAELLDESWVGRIIDENFIKDLPRGVDPCGENGEFHTFVFDGPVLQYPVRFHLGEKIYRTYPKPSSPLSSNNSSDQRTNTIGFHFIDLTN